MDMAIVADLSGNSGQSGAQDKSYCTQNRSNAGDPNGSLTPQYTGEIVLDTTNKKRWVARSLLNTGWVSVTEITPQ
jgi:hypothetical protein